jgi:hypothetical protein
MGSPQSPPCPRCFSLEPVTRPWAGFRLVRVLWIMGLCLMLAFAPVLASDIFVMIPLSTIYLFAGGSIMGLARLRPACVSCGLERPNPGWRETPCRPVRAPSGTCRHARFDPRQPRPEETSGVHELPPKRSAERDTP